MSAYIKEGAIPTLLVADDKQILIADTETEVVTGFGILRTVTDTDPGAIEDALLLPLIIRLIYIAPGLERPCRFTIYRD